MKIENGHVLKCENDLPFNLYCFLKEIAKHHLKIEFVFVFLENNAYFAIIIMDQHSRCCHNHHHLHDKNHISFLLNMN